MMGKKRINYLIIGLILFRVAYDFSPFIAYFAPRGLNMISVFALYLLMGNELGVDKAIKIIFRYLPIFMVSLLAIVFSRIKTSSPLWVQVYLLFQDVLWVLLISYVVSLKNIKLNRFLLFFVLGFFILTSLTTYYGCLKYPGISRFMTSGDLSDDERILFNLLNIGSFKFIYTVTLTIPLIIYLFKSKNLRLVFTILLIFPLLMGIYKAEYTTALVTSIICMMAFFFPQFNNRNNFLKIGLLLGGILVISSTYISDFLLWLSDIIGSDIMSVRLSDSTDIATGVGTSSGSDAALRLELWETSFNHFIEHPFLGAGDNGGGHSWLLDNMSMFGIWGLIACLIVIFNLYKLTIKPYKKSVFYYYGFFVLLLQIFLSIVNTGIFLDVFLICVPLIYYSYSPIFSKKTFQNKL